MPKPEGTVVITLYVKPELRKRFKTACSAQETSMVEAIQKFMDEYSTEYENTIKSQE